MYKGLFSTYCAKCYVFNNLYNSVLREAGGILGLAVTITVIAAVVKRAVLQIYCKKTTRSRNNKKNEVVLVCSLRVIKFRINRKTVRNKIVQIV